MPVRELNIRCVCVRVLRKGSMNFKTGNILRRPPPDNEGGVRREGASEGRVRQSERQENH